MIIVTNTIRIEPGFGERVIAQFTDGNASKNIADVEGFLGFELWHNQSAEEYEEVVVTSRWESDEAQKNWVRVNSSRKRMVVLKIPVIKKSNVKVSSAAQLIATTLFMSNYLYKKQFYNYKN